MSVRTQTTRVVCRPELEGLPAIILSKPQRHPATRLSEPAELLSSRGRLFVVLSPSAHQRLLPAVHLSLQDRAVGVSGPERLWSVGL